MKFQFLVDNKTENAKCMAEWGLSVLIETGGKRILLDAGTTDLYRTNAEVLGVNLQDVDALVISHGHFDHTGGVPSFVKVNDKAPVYLHKDALYEAYGETDGKVETEACSIQWSEEEMDVIWPRIQFTSGKVQIFDHVTLIGDIPDLEGYPATEQFWRRIEKEDGSGETELIPDTMSHEQVLVVEEEKGLYIFSGCSHRGVVPTLRHVQNLMPGKRIAGLIAGMHLYPASPAMRRKIVQEIAALDMDVVFPVHCTGMDAILQMKALMGDKCVVACTGDKYEL